MSGDILKFRLRLAMLKRYQQELSWASHFECMAMQE